MFTETEVQAYFNLRRKEFSVQRRNGKGGWVVWFYAPELNLKDVSFRVSEASRQRVIREGRKNVHAYVRGTLVKDIPETPTAATYNPYKYGSFVEKDTEAPVYSARFARLINKQIQIAK